MKNFILKGFAAIAFYVPLTAAALVGIDKEAHRMEVIQISDCAHYGFTMNRDAYAAGKPIPCSNSPVAFEIPQDIAKNSPIVTAGRVK